MIPFLFIDTLGGCHDAMGGERHFWSGEGCLVAKDGPVVAMLAGLARELDVNFLLPRTDGVTAADVRSFAPLLEQLGDERVIFGSLNKCADAGLPVVQVPGDDWIYENGQHLVSGKLRCYREQLDLETPFEAKDTRLYWVGGFSGEGRRWRLVERLKDEPQTLVRMVSRWSEPHWAFVEKHPSLVVPIQPLSDWGRYQKLLSVDGNGVGGNSTLNALLDVVYVFHGVLQPMWMRSAEAGVHYLRIDEDFSSLETVLAELDDPVRCQSLRNAVRTFMQDFIRPENVRASVAREVLECLAASRIGW